MSLMSSLRDFMKADLRASLLRQHQLKRHFGDPCKSFKPAQQRTLRAPDAGAHGMFMFCQINQNSRGDYWQYV